VVNAMDFLGGIFIVKFWLFVSLKLVCEEKEC